MLSALGLKHSEWDEIVRACFDVTPNRDTHTHTHIYGSIDRSIYLERSPLNDQIPLNYFHVFDKYSAH